MSSADVKKRACCNGEVLADRIHAMLPRAMRCRRSSASPGVKSAHSISLRLASFFHLRL